MHTEWVMSSQTRRRRLESIPPLLCSYIEVLHIVCALYMVQTVVYNKHIVNVYQQ